MTKKAPEAPQTISVLAIAIDHPLEVDDKSLAEGPTHFGCRTQGNHISTELQVSFLLLDFKPCILCILYHTKRLRQKEIVAQLLCRFTTDLLSEVYQEEIHTLNWEDPVKAP